MRNKYRSTFAHSTLAVNGKEQDEWQKGIAGLFALDETCNPKLKIDDGKIYGEHSGFGEKHSRIFTLSKNQVEINDYCADTGSKYLLFNLDTSITVDSINSVSEGVSLFLCNNKGGKVCVDLKGVADPELIPGFFGKGFGLPVENKMLKVRMLSDSAKTVFSW